MTIRLVTQPLDDGFQGRFFWQAGIALSAYRVLSLSLDGKAIYYNQLSPNYNVVLGLSLTAAAADADVSVGRSGQLTDAAWAWTPNSPVWCGVDGTLTQVAPSEGWLVQIGHALTDTKMQLEIVDEVTRI